MVSINIDAWNQITPKHQARIEALAKEMEPGFWDISVQDDKGSLATLTRHGMKVVSIPPEMMRQMREKTTHLKDAFIKRVPEAGPIVAAYLKELGKG